MEWVFRQQKTQFMQLAFQLIPAGTAAAPPPDPAHVNMQRSDSIKAQVHAMKFRHKSTLGN